MHLDTDFQPANYNITVPNFRVAELDAAKARRIGRQTARTAGKVNVTLEHLAHYTLDGITYIALREGARNLPYTMYLVRDDGSNELSPDLYVLGNCDELYMTMGSAAFVQSGFSRKQLIKVESIPNS